jgi:hypothetical protein
VVSIDHGRAILESLATLKSSAIEGGEWHVRMVRAQAILVQGKIMLTSSQNTFRTLLNDDLKAPMQSSLFLKMVRLSLEGSVAAEGHIPIHLFMAETPFLT